jgi:hypothetical protein
MAQEGSDAPEVAVLVRGEVFPVTGHAAAIILTVARDAEQVNGIAVGKMVASFAVDQLKVELRVSRPGVRLRG